jgi:RNA polymerase primary sigma factor
MAVVAGVESAVKIHIDRGDDLNARDAQGQTPLMLSAARNKAAICKLLLDAGADADLLDPSGRSALVIALAAGANEAAQAIETVSVPAAVIAAADGPSNEPEQHSSDNPSALAPAPLPVNAIAEDASALSSEPDAFEPEPATAQPLDLGTVDGDGFDLTKWEAEEDLPPPEGDPTLTTAAFEIQSAITEHQPIDTSADWDDFDAFLPDRATPLPRADDAEARGRLRLVLLRAIREGSVPQAAVEDLTLGDDGAPDTEAGALLGMVINDLGAETDERFEYWTPHESFEVFVAPEEDFDEEDAVAEAMSFVDDLASRRNDPLRIYQREFQREALLTAEAEVALGQGMERGLEKALDALAAWPTGIDAVLDAAKKVASGARPLRWLSSGAQAELHEGEAAPSPESAVEAGPTTGPGLSTEADGAEDDGDSQFGLDIKESKNELAEFCANIELLAGLPQAGSAGAHEWSAWRGAIASLGLTRSFLLELGDSGLGKKTEAALAFKQAMGDYRRARDKMAAANLKLVFAIAKKYLFSGQPLEDLLQEGNLGLLKAVDRYDWRRGFKFSTYATWWIRQQVGRFVADKSKTIRVPMHVYEKTQRIAHASHAFELEHGRAPSIEEIAAFVDLPVLKAASLVRASLETLSIEGLDDLDTLVAVDAKDQFTARDPMDIVEDMQLTSLVDRFLGELKPKEQRVVRMRFGIGIQDSMTLEEIGVRLDVTRERVRQIEAAALRKLKHPARLNKLLRDLSDALPEQSAEGTETLDDSDEEADGDELTAEAIAAALKPSPDAPASAVPERRKIAEPTALDKLLEQARAHGVAVDDESEHGVRKILVRITDAPDSRSRKLIRKLIELGFEFRPGKGYWR